MDPSISQQCDVHPGCLLVLMQRLGLHGGPDAGAKHQQKEKRHYHNAWDVQTHLAQRK